MMKVFVLVMPTETCHRPLLTLYAQSSLWQTALCISQIVLRYPLRTSAGQNRRSGRAGGLLFGAISHVERCTWLTWTENMTEGWILHPQWTWAMNPWSCTHDSVFHKKLSQDLPGCSW